MTAISTVKPCILWTIEDQLRIYGNIGNEQGRQNVPLRGLRDRGRLFSNDSTNDEDVLSNEGNLRELMRFRVESGDNLLKKNLRELKRACYVHKQPHPK
ncbi:unnamed protein product [Acanthoscelides obtectus]|uniref:Uncharacterized protein n=1 Tax=Acanthoscelides obtectus TaxID=200917 RepID=A0A9P0JJA0_ACAOB|nr:unnamed protein product [Acanthoscelides obtectus]CAK1649898.1 hypothetical protein AOBTE_LOCUS16479 [Acanthoscelides obtectus]